MQLLLCWRFFFQAEDGIRDLVRSRGLGDVYKRQGIQGLDADRSSALVLVTDGVANVGTTAKKAFLDLSLIHI